MKETTQPPVTTTVKGESITAFDKNHYMKQARLLLAQMVRIRKKAKYLRKKNYVSALNSRIRTLSQLMRAIGESKVDKDKVEQILGMLTRKAEDIDSDLDKEMIKTMEEESTVSTTLPTTGTTTEEEETTTVSTTLPTTGTTTVEEDTTTVDTTLPTTGTTTAEEDATTVDATLPTTGTTTAEEDTTTVDTTLPTTGTTTAEEDTTTVSTIVPATEATTEEITTKQAVNQISNTDRTTYTKQARSLIMECVRLRKKASQTGQRKYVGALNSYIKALARIMKQVRGSTFDKKQVEDALKLFKTKVSEIDSVLEQSISTESTSILEKTLEVTTPFVSEVGEFIVFVTEMKP